MDAPTEAKVVPPSQQQRRRKVSSSDEDSGVRMSSDGDGSPAAPLPPPAAGSSLELDRARRLTTTSAAAAAAAFSSCPCSDDEEDSEKNLLLVEEQLRNFALIGPSLDNDESHTSSLESLDRLRVDFDAEANFNKGPYKGLGDACDAASVGPCARVVSCGSSTSCSDDSFELCHSSSENTLGKSSGDTLIVPSTVFMTKKESIHEELEKLDTALPQLDFDLLEKQLKNAQMERERSQRRLLGERVRQRLAADGGTDDEEDQGGGPCSSYSNWQGLQDILLHPPPPATRPKRSNLAQRLQYGMNLQMCYMNDAVPTTSDEEGGDDDDDDSSCCNIDETEAEIPKSKSTPELSGRLVFSSSWFSANFNGKRTNLNRSKSNADDDSQKRASKLRAEHIERLNLEHGDEGNCAGGGVLQQETRVMLAKAKQAAHLQMEIDRVNQQETPNSSTEHLIGTSFGKKFCRMQLSKMGLAQLQVITNGMHSKIAKLNDELVQLLIQRDNLHMEQDSMLIDIEDLIEHKKASDLNLPDFLILQPPGTAKFSRNTFANNGRFKLFKK